MESLSDRSLTVIFDDNQNAAPVVTAQASPDIVNGNGTVQLSGTATDPDPTPDTLALALSATPNVGTFSAIMQNGNNWTAVWTAPGPMDDDQPVAIQMAATEPDESLVGTAHINVTVRANRAPVVTHVADMMTVDAGDVVNLTATAMDPEGQAMTFNRTSDIGGAFTNRTALVATWVAPTVTESTLASLTFLATDSGGVVGTAIASVIVRPPAFDPLALPAVADMTGETGTVINMQLPAATDGVPPYIYSVAGLTANLGIAFRNSTRRLQGIPQVPGTFMLTYAVTDSNQDMVSRMFTLMVTGNPIPQPTGRNMRIDWGSQFYANAHSNVTGRITSGIECERGRNTASAVLGRSQAGLLRFELQNSDGLFDEENPDSALAGLIRPRIQVQLRDGVTPIWTGVLDSIPTRFERNGQHRAEVTAFGVLSTAENPDVSGGSLTPESTAQAFIELCAKGDVPSEQPQPQPGDAYVMRRWWEIGKLWGHGSGALDHIEDTEGGFVHEDREGEVGFHLANFRGTRTVNKTFVSTTPGANQIRIVGNPRRQNAVKDVHNVVSGDVRQFETKADETVFMSEEAIPIALGGRIDLVSVYPISRGAVSELDALVAGTDWSANTSADGTGNNRTSQVTVTVELMDFNEIHIQILYPTMTGTQADTLYIRGLTVTGTVLSVGTALRVTREDTVSKERYGPETLTLNDTWVRSTADMEARADAILDTVASPERRVSLDWYVHDWADFFALDLSDRVRVELPTISSDGFNEGIRLRIPLSQVNPICTLDVSLVD